MDPTFDDILAALKRAQEDATTLNAEGQPTRSRELSLCITKIQEARFWLEAGR